MIEYGKKVQWLKTGRVVQSKAQMYSGVYAHYDTFLDMGWITVNGKRINFNRDSWSDIVEDIVEVIDTMYEEGIIIDNA